MTDKKESKFRLDLQNVTRSCIACARTVVTNPQATPLCAVCRANDPVGVLATTESTAKPLTPEEYEAYVAGEHAGVGFEDRWPATVADRDRRIAELEDSLRAVIGVLHGHTGVALPEGDVLADPEAGGRVMGALFAQSRELVAMRERARKNFRRRAKVWRAAIRARVALREGRHDDALGVLDEGLALDAEQSENLLRGIAEIMAEKDDNEGGSDE